MLSTTPIYEVVRKLQCVPHRRLLYKLHYYRIRGSIHKWIASWPSEHCQNGWPSLRSSPCLISCPSRIGLGTGPVLDFHKWSSGQYQVICSLMIVFCLGILIHSQIARFYKMTWIAQCETGWQVKFNVAKCHSKRREEDRIHFYWKIIYSNSIEL